MVGTGTTAADFGRMTSHGVVALACVRCENGYSVLTLSHPIAELMSKEQLDAVKDQLLSDENSDLRQKVFSVYFEEPERGANMIIAFATDKGLKLDATPGEVVDYLESLDEVVDIDVSSEELAYIAGGPSVVDSGRALHISSGPLSGPRKLGNRM